uniref:Ribosomal protein L32 n=1 Tax=Testulea gabonensis TaxID=1501080 RepID=A0A8F3EJK9_9ROSI|nr:ribosomal protein L32 [Testulea gabonensis]
MAVPKVLLSKKSVFEKIFGKERAIGQR